MGGLIFTVHICLYFFYFIHSWIRNMLELYNERDRLFPWRIVKSLVIWMIASYPPRPPPGSSPPRAWRSSPPGWWTMPWERCRYRMLYFCWPICFLVYYVHVVYKVGNFGRHPFSKMIDQIKTMASSLLPVIYRVFIKYCGFSQRF